MSRNYKISDNTKAYFVTFTVINWMDVFIRNEYRQIFIDSIKFCQKNKGLNVYAWCLMTSHSDIAWQYPSPEDPLSKPFDTMIPA